MNVKERMTLDSYYSSVAGSSVMARRTSRTKKRKQFSLYLDSGERKRVAEQAIKEGCSGGDVLRRLIREHLT
ncbi:MAG: hypothetical protein ACHQQR_10720 [Gemmatimonadales bacterium]